MKECNTEELYASNRQRLLNLIQSKVHDSQKAEDLLHDSFEKMYTCCDGCVCESPRSYLFRTAINTVMDFFKLRKKEKNTESNLEFISDEKAAEPPLLDSEKCDLITCINDLLKDMSEENRQAFTLVDIQQRPQVEVAEELGLSISTLKSRVQRTRKVLKQKLENCCPEFRQNCI